MAKKYVEVEDRMNEKNNEIETIQQQTKRAGNKPAFSFLDEQGDVQNQKNFLPDVQKIYFSVK